MASRKDNDEPLKAVVFADACGSSNGPTFPSTKELLNIPILAWQLGTLARYGVKEVIVLSSEPIEISYYDPLDRMKVTPLSSPSWTSEGDAIRDLESRDGLRPVDDFVLVQLGAVFNVDVEKLVAAHKKRKDVDRNWLITTTFRRGAGTVANGLVIGVDSTTGTLVKYVEKLDETGISIDVLAENAGLQHGGIFEICSDVVDIGLDVCAPDFLLEFRENFYYDRVRAYIKEKLDGGEAEVFGNRMYAHYLDSTEGEYGTRIYSLASLAQATSDVLGGWMAPMTPALINGTLRVGSVLTYQSDYMLEQSTVGEGVSIAVGSAIIDSVICDDVQIGSDTTVTQSIIMDGTIIGDSCDIERSVLEENCTIGNNSLIPKNCYLDAEVTIGPEFYTMMPYSLITTQHAGNFGSNEENSDDSGDSDDSDDTADDTPSDSSRQNGGTSTAKVSEAKKVSVSDSENPWKEQHVGKDGHGRLIDPNVTKSLDLFFTPVQQIYDQYVFESDDEDELEGNDELETRANGAVDDLARKVKSSTLEEDNAGDLDEEQSRILKFFEEMLETIERAFAEDVDLDNTALEVNSLKLAYNCSFPETLTGVVAGLARTVEKRSSAEQLYPEIDSALVRYTSLLQKFEKTEDSTRHFQVASGLASALSQNGTLLMYVYKAMYERDMLEEEGILRWASEERERVGAGKGDKLLLTTVSPLIDWLEAPEEDED